MQPEIIRFSGYACEVHQVVTEDGYLLHMHRIPYKTDAPKKSVRRPSIILQHGLLADSSCWVSNGPENSLAFILANEGAICLALLRPFFSRFLHGFFVVRFYN